MILISLGANLPGRFGPPEATLEEAKRELARRGVRVVQSSRTWRTEPVPVSDDPWYMNAVIAVETHIGPRKLFELLKGIERDFGRVKPVQDAPRILDMDLLAYGEDVINEERLSVPHPRMEGRAFVLLPLQEVAPEWKHPSNGQTIAQMIAAMPPGQKAEPLQDKAA